MRRDAQIVKYLQLLWIVAIVLIGTSCGAAESPPSTPPPAGGSAATPAADLATGDATAVLLEATTVPTPIPVTSTPTPRPLPPTPMPRPTATLAPEQTEAGKPLTDLAEIPAGPFTMGRADGPDNEGPAHEVDLPTYYIEIFEVTNAQFAAFTAETGYVTDAEKAGGSGWRAYTDGKDTHPAVKISWNDARAYCDWAGRRLPTEAEWEKAARGPAGFLYPWGNDWDPEKANVKAAGYRGTTQGRAFPRQR
jgi:formylglycine-generating enzyme required for sulfatase activity